MYTNNDIGGLNLYDLIQGGVMPQYQANDLKQTAQLSGMMQPQGLNSITPEAVAPTATASNTAPQSQSWLSDTWDYLTKGGGSNKMTPQESRQYQSLINGLNYETDPEIRAQLEQQKNDLMAGTQDRGGLFGSLGRMATGQGQTTGENTGTAIGMFAMPLLKAYLNQRAAQAMSNGVRNQYNQNASMMQGNINNILNR